MNFPSAWQMPQGGIDEGEKPEDAAMRELKEEIGTNNAAIITSLEPWLYYDFPQEVQKNLWQGHYKGQKQKWYALRFSGEDSEINIHTAHPEFSNWRWAEVDEVLSNVVFFKKAIYEEVFQQLYPEVLRLS